MHRFCLRSNTSQWTKQRLESNSSVHRNKDPSVPLLIGINDLSAYKMTPIPYAHTFIVGDFLQKNEPIEFSGLIPFQDWSVAIKAFQHQQATVKKIEKLMHTIKRPKKPTKLKSSRPQYDNQHKSDIIKMNKALVPEQKLYSKDKAEEIVKHLLYMNLQNTRSDPNSAEEFTADKVTGTMSLGVACRCIEYLMHERDNKRALQDHNTIINSNQI